ncbi:MAG TPA: glycosyltransferase family 4 protein [Candidatus Paceibacterota bacterium]|nr:glycosyltransferase family 4 protein [Verrucomicrobiota bacterium]HRY46434.1 glycosyltransferase family 4 protein [Candidatus Paceibacterota bacterium]HSA02433.1 glycosyltransferase family 4 protein [Candidatus Paceibacterota bacterium]
MNRLPMLYLDVPFENESGGDKNRSRFLWQALRETCSPDLILMGHPPTTDHPAWTRFEPLALLPPYCPPFPRSASIPSFRPQDHHQFQQFLREKQHQAVFARFCSGWELCHRAAGQMPHLAMVMDVDMLSSRLAALSWASQPSFRRRWFLFEKWKLRNFERQLFREPWLFFFTNPAELAEVRDHIAPHSARGEFALLPNTMPRSRDLENIPRKPAILFFGSMDSAANIDGFAFLVDHVFPLLEEDLKNGALEIHIVGKKPPAHFHQRLAQIGTDRVKIKGGVDSIERAIAESLFVLLPLRIASGTRTRILEAAAQRRAVVTTPIGAEGLDLGDSLLIGNTVEALAAHVRRLIAHRDEADALGLRLHQRAVSLYSPDKVAAGLVRRVEDFVKRKKGNAP